MRQIPYSSFETIVEKLKKTDDFTDFLKKVQNRIDEFVTKPEFKYGGKLAKNKKVVKVYKIGKSPAKDIEYNIILKKISNVSDLMFMNPSTFKKILEKTKELNENNPIDKAFSDKIQSLLMYTELRSGDMKLLHSFYKELGIKSCVYCNAQHTVLLDDDKRTMRLQADHHIPKSKFPMFSITLANLIPVCNNCNHLKSTHDLKYNLYYDDINGKHHDLGFSLTEESIALYCANRNSENSEKYLELNFKDYYEDDTSKSSKLNEVLKINKIYENHKDLAADLINKKIVYKDSYLSSLGKEFGTLFKRNDGSINKHLFNQMLYGHTLEESDINKKVFSKLTIDIKNQLDKLDVDKYLNSDGS
ncbi:HNH endonuclease [Sphingobacterium corticibacterium]|uniref:HNH domain-containing protein n=1 Tax=Sphingobacterium corticibacterium TaxID=2484746 RepID=A0A4Q6XUX9_9SPHI|nr:HNH endonuclease [Sphingobacterium corticibacterium]RZF61462.1 hypothetical protein EWE74_01060 [Sphingobacterium corticibacterium]